MKKTLLLGLALSTLLFAKDTAVIFDKNNNNEPKFIEVTKYGESLYRQTVHLEKEAFETQYLYSDHKAKNDIYTNVEIDLLVSSTAACSDGGVDVNGCSGQKPFLINHSSVLDSASDGDTVTIMFKPAPDYTSNDKDSFFPMDIERNEDYYKENPPSGSTSGEKSFFDLFAGMFDVMFNVGTFGLGGDFFGRDSGEVTTLGSSYSDKAALDRRQRYLANIAAGVDQEHRLIISETNINSSENTPTSLVSYGNFSVMTGDTSCSGLLLNTSSDGIFCRMMTGFQMDKWMPFFEGKKITTQTVENTIVTDTESAILALAGMHRKDEGIINNVDGRNDSFLGNMFKPMITMFGGMMDWMYQSKPTAKTGASLVQTDYSMEDNPIAMSFAVASSDVGSGSASVESFVNAELLTLSAIYGSAVESCKVRYNSTIFLFFPVHENYTFSRGVAHSERMYVSKSVYDLAKNDPVTASKTDSGFKIIGLFPKYMYWINMNEDDWLAWCQINAEDQNGDRGFFGHAIDRVSDKGLIYAMSPVTWMMSAAQTFWDLIREDYEVKEYNSKIDRGLIITLKKIGTTAFIDYKRDTVKVQRAHSRD